MAPGRIAGIPVLLALACLAAGPAGAAFEKGGLLDAGPRSAGIAGAVSALADDVPTAKGAPAGLVTLEGPQIAGSQAIRGEDGLGAQVLGAGVMAGGIGFAVSGSRLSMEGIWEETAAIGIGIPFEEFPGLSVGASVKSLSANYGTVRATGSAVDVAVLARHPTPVAGLELRWAGGIEDAFAGVKWNTGYTETPDRQARLGLGARYAERTTLLGEVRIITAALGIERLYAAGIERTVPLSGVTAAFRGGWRGSAVREASFTGGAGLRWAGVMADYAAIRGEGGNLAHLVGVGWTFGGSDRIGARATGIPAAPMAAIPTGSDDGARIRISPARAVVDLAGLYDEVELGIRCPPLDGTVTWAAVVMDHCGEVIWSMEGSDRPPLVIRWNGTSCSGELARSGTYAAALIIRGPGAYRYCSPTEAFALRRPVEQVLEPPGELPGSF